jgi:hypothetical protein
MKRAKKKRTLKIALSLLCIGTSVVLLLSNSFLNRPTEQRKPEHWCFPTRAD